MLALTGRCYEAGTTPFSPFVDIVEQMLREVPAGMLREALGEDAPEIARLVPRIRRVWDDLPEPSPLAPEQQRHILFSAMLDFFRRLSVQQPVVVLLDDLHWADEATVGLLQYLAAALVRPGGAGRWAHIATSSSTSASRSRRRLAAFVRQPQVFRVPVRCLPQTAVAELLSAFGGSEPPAAVVEAIFQETEGNPFFVGEMFQHLSEEGQLFDEAGTGRVGLARDALDVPEGVRLVIRRRLGRLSEATPTLLTTAAVIGRQFELTLVETLRTLDGDAFLESNRGSRGGEVDRLGAAADVRRATSSRTS